MVGRLRTAGKTGLVMTKQRQSESNFGDTSILESREAVLV